MFNTRYGLEQAVLDGRKTMTRRAVTNKVAIELIEQGYPAMVSCTGSPYKIGEVVAIAQSYKDCVSQASNRFGLRDNLTKGLSASAGWCNKMFVKSELMPHHIRITNIRVERLQDISDEDCLREGIYEFEGFYTSTHDRIVHDEAKYAFASLIDKVSGKGTWEKNPYVFVYEFELID